MPRRVASAAVAADASRAATGSAGPEAGRAAQDGQVAGHRLEDHLRVAGSQAHAAAAESATRRVGQVGRDVAAERRGLGGHVGRADEGRVTTDGLDAMRPGQDPPFHLDGAAHRAHLEEAPRRRAHVHLARHGPDVGRELLVGLHPHVAGDAGDIDRPAAVLQPDATRDGAHALLAEQAVGGDLRGGRVDLDARPGGHLHLHVGGRGAAPADPAPMDHLDAQRASGLVGREQRLVLRHVPDARDRAVDGVDLDGAEGDRQGQRAVWSDLVLDARDRPGGGGGGHGAHPSLPRPRSRSSREASAALTSCRASRSRTARRASSVEADGAAGRPACSTVGSTSSAARLPPAARQGPGPG